MLLASLASLASIPHMVVAPVCRISTRYGQQAELKEQNQQLVGVNEELQKNLLDTQVRTEKQHLFVCLFLLNVCLFVFLTQQRVAELKLQIDELQNENVEMKKKLHDCHVLLVSARIDPGFKMTRDSFTVSE